MTVLADEKLGKTASFRILVPLWTPSPFTVRKVAGAERGEAAGRPRARDGGGLGGLGGLTMSPDGGLEEFEEFQESLAIRAVNCVTWAINRATCCSSAAMR